MNEWFINEVGTNPWNFKYYKCGKFISKKAVISGEVDIDDVSDGIEYGPPIYDLTHISCMTKGGE